MTYGRWAARRDPYSFAIYPLLGLAAPLIWWVGVGAVAGLVVLAITESLVIGLGVYVFYVRRRRLRR
jgi:hypothetical protein